MRVSLRQCPCFSLLGGVAIGAGLVYLLDFDRGVSRRTRLQSGLRNFGGLVDEKVRAVRESLQATPLRRVTQLSVVPRKPVPDWVLAERTRLETWRTLAHPDSVHISVNHGNATVWGPVLAGEPEALHAGLLKVQGLRHIELQLTTREDSAAARELRAS